MAAFNFPNSPSTNDVHTENGVSWKWNGTVWKKVASPDTIAKADSKVQVVDAGTGGYITAETDGTQRLRVQNSGAIVTGILTATSFKDSSGNTIGQTGAQGHQGVQGAVGAQGVQGAANATTINNNANNKVITGSGSANTLEAEGNLTYDGTTLKVNHTTNPILNLTSTNGGPYNTYLRMVGNDTELRGSNGNIEFFTGAADGTSSTERFRIRSDGTLRVGGDLYTATDIMMSLKNTAGTGSQIQFHGTGTGDGSSDGFRVGYNGSGGQLWLFEDQYVRIATNNTEKLRITADGTCHLAYQGGNTNAQKVKITGTQHNFAVNNWGNSDGDYWMFGSNIEGNSGGNWSKPSTTTRAAGIVVDGRMGRTILLSSQTSTGTIDEHFTFDNSGVFHINKNGGGVSFAANTDNGGTSSATLMDDYEEGSYSSTIVSSNCTLDNSSATGYYIKVGNLVQVRGTFAMNTNSGSPSKSGSDNIVQSLPYTPVGNGTYTGTMLQQNWNWGGPTTSAHPHWFNPLVADYVCLAASDGIRFYMNRIEYAYQRMNNSHLHVGYPGYTAIYWSIMYQTT